MAITFVVENGTGKSDSTSYSDLAYAEQYVLDYVTSPTDWNGATDDEKKQALNIASRYLDSKYGAVLQGYKKLSTQSLQWPRTYVVDRDGNSIDYDSIPDKWKQATVEVAVYSIGGNDLFANLDSGGALKAEKIKIDVITIEKQWSGSNEQSTVTSKIDGLVDEYLKSGSAVTTEVRRG